MTFTHALSTNNYGPAKFVVATSAANGTHTTLASAMAVASSGDTIILRDSVTENVTVTPGVNICSWPTGSSLNATGKAAIIGTLTMTAAGSVTLSGIQLQTNSAALLAVTGSAASVVNLQNCNLNCSNNSGITFSSSSSSAAINLQNCTGNLGTTGIKLFDHSSAGALTFQNTIITNTGASTTASTVSAGGCGFYFSVIFSPITTSSTGGLGLSYSGIDTSALNVTSLTSGGSGQHLANTSSFSSGTTSAVSISNTTTMVGCYVNSTNTNAITGAGTLNYNNPTFPIGSSVKINTTTQVGGVAAGGLTQAPSAGFIGEHVRAVGTSVALTSTVVANITSISLTAGVWDISVVSTTAFTLAGTTIQLGISDASATLQGTVGDQFVNVVGAAGAFTTGQISACVPAFRVVITSTTTIYAVAEATFTTGTASVSGRISATRVA